MKSLSKYLSLLLTSILCLLLSVACRGGADPDPDPDPDPETVSSLVVLDRQFEVGSAGCYYDEKDQGYHFVVASEKLDLNKAISDVPKGSLIMIDIPKQYCGKEYDIKDVKDVIDEKENGWYFYILYTQDGVTSQELTVDNGEIVSGKISLVFDLHKKVNCKMSITLKDGKKLECVFDGRYQKSDQYICGWAD